MDSPIKTWLKQRGVRTGDLALAVPYDTGNLSRVLTGQKAVTGRLRAFLQEHAPDVLAAQEAYYTICQAEARKRLAA